jgi:hypothetical protein
MHRPQDHLLQRSLRLGTIARGRISSLLAFFLMMFSSVRGERYCPVSVV